MKKIILSAAMICATSTLFAQTKNEPKPAPTKPKYQKVMVLPKEVIFSLTKQQVMRMDSAINAIENSIDSKSASRWIISSFDVIFDTAKKQMVLDSVIITK